MAEGAAVVGSVAVRVVPDANGFDDRLRAQLKKISDVKVTVDLDDADAAARLAAINGEIDRVDGRHVRVRVDASGVGEAEHGMSGLLSAIIALGPAVVPLGAVLTGGLLGAGAAAAALGTGVGVVALGAKQVASEMSSEVVPAFRELQHTAANGLFPGADVSIHNLLGALPGLDDLVRDVAHTLGRLAAEASDVFSGTPYWQHFLSFVDSSAGPTLSQFGDIIGDVAHGAAGLAEAFGPVVNEIGAGLERLTSEFASFGAGAAHDAGFQRFLAYVETEGPQVVHVLGDIVGAGAHLTAALAPVGVIVLTVVDDFAKLVAAVPTPVLTGLALAAGTTVVALKAMSVADSISRLLVKLGAAAASDATGFAGLRQTLGGLRLGSVAAGVGVTGLVAVIGTAIAGNAQLEAQVKATTDALNAEFSPQQADSLRGLVAQMRQVDEQYRQSIANQKGPGGVTGFITDLYDTFTTGQDAAENAADKLDDAWYDQDQKMKKVLATIRQLSSEYGISGTQALTVYTKAGIQAADSVSTINAKVRAYMTTAAASSSVSKGVAQDLNAIRSGAVQGADAISALDDAWQRLMGNFVAAKQAEADAAADLIGLRKALHDSAGSLNANTQAGNAARQSLLRMPSAIKGVVDSVYTQTGSWSAARHAAEQYAKGTIASLRAAGASGPLVKHLIDQIHSYMSRLRQVGQTSGAQLDRGLAQGIKSNSGVAYSQALYMASHITRVIDGPQGFDSHSPSKKGHQSGSWLVQGIAGGIEDEAQTAYAKALDVGKGTVAAITAGIKAEKAGLLHQIDDIKQKMSSLRDSITQGLRSPVDLSNLTLRGNITDPVLPEFTLDTATNTLVANQRKIPGTAPSGQVASAFDQGVGVDEKFVALLKKGDKKGVPPALLDQIAALGPDQGLQLIRDIDRSSPAEIRSIRHDTHVINDLSRTYATSAAQERYGPTLQRSEKHLKDIKTAAHQTNKTLAKIERNTRPKDHVARARGKAA